MTLLILFFTLSIGFSFICSILEAVLLSVTPSYMNRQFQEGTSLGKSLKKFKGDIDRPLSAILTLNTIAHTVGAIGVGLQAGKLFGESSMSIGPVHISLESIIAGLMTLAILILSEIIPKTLGANYWKALTPFTISSLNLLLVILGPFVWMSQMITKNLKTDKDKSIFSRADLSAMAQAGEDSGILRSLESSTIKNLMTLDKVKVNSIMTPRNVMVSAEEGKSLQSFYDEHIPLRHSRIPIFDKKKEHVIGVLLKYDLLEGLLKGKEEEPIESIMIKPIFVNQHITLSKYQNRMMQEKSHMAIVVDDFGSVLGLVTMEDLFETILGMEIMDESDNVEDLQKFARDIWERRAKDIGIVK